MIDVATGAAKRAGEILLSHWRNLPAGSVEEKAKNDFVSIADRESERAIVETILAAFPGDGILGEEGARRPGTSGREWVIDPLDGTSNFIAGFPFWCVSIGVRQAGETLAGVVWDPLREETVPRPRRGAARFGTGNGSPCRGGPPPRERFSRPVFRFESTRKSTNTSRFSARSSSRRRRSDARGARRSTWLASRRESSTGSSSSVSPRGTSRRVPS